MNGRSRRTNGGFTLIELLVVIVIIGLLAGMALVALGGARGFFQGATAKARLNDVSTALELYKSKYGEYPPDYCANDAAIKRHILKRWPKALKSGQADAMVAFAKDSYSGAPGNALLFWIAGPDAEGFSADEAKPFGEYDASSGNFAISDADPRETPIMELAYDSDGSGGGNYNDKGLMFRGIPIAYFRAEKGKYDGKEFPAGGNGVAAPYMKNGAWYNKDSFQLILPGEDENFGEDPYGDDDHAAHPGHEDEYVARDLADGATTGAADADNVANFAEGATIEAEIE